jgi:hypothetical protein
MRALDLVSRPRVDYPAAPGDRQLAFRHSASVALLGGFAKNRSKLDLPQSPVVEIWYPGSRGGPSPRIIPFADDLPPSSSDRLLDAPDTHPGSIHSCRGGLWLVQITNEPAGDAGPCTAEHFGTEVQAQMSARLGHLHQLFVPSADQPRHREQLID